MKTINIDGVEYIEKQEETDYEHVCVIVQQGWIFEGYALNEECTHLRDSNVVRSWSNGKGIGGLANQAYKDDYTLDYIGEIKIHPQSVIAVIPLRW